MVALVFDTETTGKYDFYRDHSHPRQPNIVELAGVAIDDDTFEEIDCVSSIILPDGWTIDNSEIHGITHEHACAAGIPLKSALTMFNFFIQSHRPDILIAHNLQFDANVMVTGYFRAGVDPTVLRDVPRRFCTKVRSTDILKLPGRRGWKWPKLEEAYQFFCGEPMPNAHRALDDARACVKVYEGIRKFNGTESSATVDR